MTTENSCKDVDVSSLNECLDHIRHAHASELARSGNYPEAEAILLPDTRLPESPRDLDLLARMAAQQARFEDAARYWKAALERAPENAVYKECLQRLSDLQSDDELGASPRSMILAWCVAATTILLITAYLIFAHGRPAVKSGMAATVGASTTNQATRATESTDAGMHVADTPSKTSSGVAFAEGLSASTAQSVAALRLLEQRFAELQNRNQEQIHGLKSQLCEIQATNLILLGQVEKAESRLTQLAESTANVLDSQIATRRAIDSGRTDIASLLSARSYPASGSQNTPPVLAGFNPSIPGVSVATTTNGCLIRFSPALFDRDCHYKMGARARLQSLAKALVQAQARIKVQVIGIADDEPPIWPWSPHNTPESLARRRAECAAAYLLHLGIFSPDKLSAVAATPAHRPFPSGDRRNRTVMIEVLIDPTGQPDRAH